MARDFSLGCRRAAGHSVGCLAPWSHQCRPFPLRAGLRTATFAALTTLAGIASAGPLGYSLTGQVQYTAGRGAGSATLGICGVPDTGWLSLTNTGSSVFTGSANLSAVAPSQVINLTIVGTLNPGESRVFNAVCRVDQLPGIDVHRAILTMNRPGRVQVAAGARASPSARAPCPPRWAAGGSLRPGTGRRRALSCALNLGQVIAGDALGRPGLPRLVVAVELRHRRVQQHPRRPGLHEDVRSGRPCAGHVQGAHPQVDDQRVAAAVDVPEHRMALGTSDHPVAAPAVGGHPRVPRFALQHLQMPGLDHQVVREGAAGLALAARAMAGVDEQRRLRQPERKCATGASALDGRHRATPPAFRWKRMCQLGSQVAPSSREKNCSQVNSSAETRRQTPLARITLSW